MANSWANALGAGLSTFGSIKMGMDEQKRREEERARLEAERAELAKEEKAAAETRERFRAARQLPRVSTIEKMGPDGKVMKVSMQSRYDPDSDSVVTEELGSVPLLSAKERNAQVETFYDEATGQPYKAERAEDGSWKRIGGMQAKRGSGGARAENPPKATSLTAPQIEGLFSTTNELGESSMDAGKYRDFLAFQARNAQKDPKYRDANFAVQQWANQVGFDPNEKPAGTFTLDEADAPLMVGEKPKKADAAPGSSKDNPVTASSPSEVAKLPSGTWVRLPNGQVRQK